MPLFQPEQATSTSAMFTGLEQDGQPVEAAWPYSAHLPIDIKTYTPPSTTELFRHRGQVLQGLGDAETWLRAGWPVILGIALTASFYLINSLQTVESDPDLNVFGYHAVLAVGLLQRADGVAFLIRNTWGLSWGDQSHAILSSDYLEPRLKFVGGFRA